MLLTVLIAAAGLSLAMAGAWLLQQRTGDGGWADVVWSFATGGAGVLLAVAPQAGRAPGPRAILIAALVATWAIRLGLHLWRRAARAAHEDARYAELRREWGPALPKMMFGFLQVQALAALVLALSILAAARNPAPFPAWSDLAGLVLFAAALVGESAADAQLARFRADPANRRRICDQGLWAWSRHPNYFFEWLGWSAYAVFAIGPTGARLFGWSALVGPAFMFVLLRHLSGVPPTEAAMVRSRGADFANYQARVSAFFPWPPRGARPPKT